MLRFARMRTIVLVYAACVIYAAIRYLALMPENLENLPVYLLNKGWSMAAALCFAFGFFQQRRKDRGHMIGVEPATWFRAGVFGVIAHIPMSLAILRPGYFKEFFASATEAGAMMGRMTFTGEMVFLFGGLTAGGVYLLTRTHWTPIVRWRLSLITMLTLATHVTSMGICRGLNIDAKHAYLPPMWFLSLIGIGFGIWWLLQSRPASIPSSSQSAPWTQEKR